MPDFIEVTVRINVQGEETVLTKRIEPRVGQHVTVETAKHAADVAARCAVLHSLGPAS